MATIKHIPSKNADYGATEAYLTFEHDEFTMKPTLDEAGRLIPRQDYRLETLNCGEEDFALSYIRANLRYGKNSKRDDVKSHHYIISFDLRDASDNGLTVDRVQALGLAYCKEHFHGHQAIICTHPDGHNHSGNIHVHIVINSLRIAEVERKPYMDRASDTRAGDKHRYTAASFDEFSSLLLWEGVTVKESRGGDGSVISRRTGRSLSPPESWEQTLTKPLSLPFSSRMPTEQQQTADCHYQPHLAGNPETAGHRPRPYL